MLKSVSSILMSVALLLLGNGLLNTLLALRGTSEGFSTLMLGFVLSGYFFGFICGTWVSGRLIRRMGHIRTFAFCASLCASAALLHVLWVNPWVWAGIEGHLRTGVRNGDHRNRKLAKQPSRQHRAGTTLCGAHGDQSWCTGDRTAGTAARLSGGVYAFRHCRRPDLLGRNYTLLCLGRALVFPVPTGCGTADRAAASRQNHLRYRRHVGPARRGLRSGAHFEPMVQTSSEALAVMLEEQQEDLFNAQQPKPDS